MKGKEKTRRENNDKHKKKNKERANKMTHKKEEH